MNRRIKALWRRIHSAARGATLPDFRDLHIYGGLLLLAAGLGAAYGLGAALAAPGAALFYLGVWRLR